MEGVTGSCHQLKLADGQSILIDCGLFQGKEAAEDGSNFEQLQIKFSLRGVKALVITHVHIDHVGRLPYLLAAGFQGPIICSEASAALLPLVLEDALKVGFTRDENLIRRFINKLHEQIEALPYNIWHTLFENENSLRIRLQPAGHILGSAYVECDLSVRQQQSRIVFSGDLGAPHTPLLPAPTSPERAEVVVLESTYGDRCHEDRRHRRQKLLEILEHALSNQGTVLIPAFSMGRTQELLYELEQIIHEQQQSEAAPGIAWRDMEIILDSPLAADFTHGYRKLRDYWDREAINKIERGRHPLAFEQLLTISDHKTHLQTVEYLAQGKRPAIVIAASGMCNGGRIMNYLKAMLEDSRHDVVFVGYQAEGTPGRIIQEYGPRNGYVELEGKRYTINALIHTIGGYSAHADQQDLINFIANIPVLPEQVILVHGSTRAKQALKNVLQEKLDMAAIKI